MMAHSKRTIEGKLSKIFKSMKFPRVEIPRATWNFMLNDIERKA